MRMWNITVLVLALFISSCSDYANNPDSGIPDADSADGSNNSESAGDEGEKQTSVMVLFMVDTSQSMAVVDPHALRRTEVARAVNMHADDPRVRFAIMRIGSQVALLTDGFIVSLSTLNEAIIDLNTVQGMASYRDAFALAKTTLEESMTAERPVPNKRTRYCIFLLSDSMYEPGYNEEEALADWSSIIELGTHHGVKELEAHTALIMDPDFNPQPDTLESMIEFMSGLAEEGGGTFTNYHDSDYLDFEGTIVP